MQSAEKADILRNRRGGLAVKKIVVLAPLPEMKALAEEIVRKQNYHNVDVLLGSMSQGMEVAREAIAQGAEIIVTRGGTYQLAKEAFQIPVVEIKVTAYDIIRSFGKVDNPDETIGVVGYSNVVYGYDLLRELLPNPVVLVELQRESDVYAVIGDHKRRGIKTYIGDANITRIIRELNCNGIMIESQMESIHTAIQEARRIHSATKEEKRRAQQIATITDFVHDAIIAIDEHEKITVYNQMAEQIFGVPRKTALGAAVTDVVPNTQLPEILVTGQSQLSQLQNLRESTIVTNRMPILVDGEVKGAVATFQDITEVQNLEQKIRRSLSEKGFLARYTFEDIVYVSAQMRDCIKTAREFARYDTPVHICGASGVGKELFCQSMHNAGPRRRGPFVAINCAAIPASLIESEFFGYEEGSFTGARRKGKPGIFELAHGGTLFLDEISEIPMELQGRLLRVLQEKEVMRVGGDKIIPVDVKIITASNKYLKREIEEGHFRRDLYYRINVLALRIPPLSRRKEDIPALARYFLKKYTEKYGKAPMELSPEVEERLLRRSYEGNARELEGLIERCVITASFDGVLEEEGATAPSSALPAVLNGQTNLDLKSLERLYIQTVHDGTGENIQKTCEILGINRSTLWRKLKDMQ